MGKCNVRLRVDLTGFSSIRLTSRLRSSLESVRRQTSVGATIVGPLALVRSLIGSLGVGSRGSGFGSGGGVVGC